MKLLVVVLCLLSERFLIHTASCQRFYWFGDYYLSIKKTIDKNSFFTNPWMILAATILPIIFVTSIIYFLLHNILFGFLGLILSIVLFFYCLGPQNAFYPISESSSELPNNTLVGSYFAQVNRQLFSVVFWYILAGPIAVLTYRLITLCRDINSMSQQADQVTNILEWIPARLSALLFLLVGNFQRGFILYTRLFFSKPELNSQLLSNCGLQAARTSESDEIPLPVAESLVEHATIVFMVLIALFTLVAWL
ncbi:regulatory signaling modulator protein AmpE [Legionella maioricensis]|uniref:Regulatory signaling modulator protein AmpE n=1 Tax=Legionella maioricensis TaxID=2896528 RepID=A0A9X2D3N8_9GAMM|nr:regulatory signaling modulator protein AmpE [Legionella maioricensis]MCL9685653.1 regulatory signaling modulator protein AmpE [Legionella maioricensis]MCL9689081.1 regulatory signaling modulator protein AmpE [Legionella maioricensis]